MTQEKDNPKGTIEILEAVQNDPTNGQTNVRRSLKWFVDRVKQKTIATVAADRVLTIGHMYLYHYDPKYKATLPYYDRVPLTIPINYYKDGFLGLNLHYLPMDLRKVLLKNMIDKFGDGVMESQYIKAQYHDLNELAGTPYYAPCVHRYLYSHMGGMKRIPPSEWVNAVSLPTARWVGSSAQNVYAQSRKKY